MELMSCPNQTAPADVMRHIVHVESGYNPFAIGVVGAQLVRQPQNLDEAVATAQMLEANGYNYSLGVAQVNRNNLSKYGLDTYAKAFNTCLNLSVGSRILNECYARSGGNWGKAFSCYYSGDFVTGFSQGYVQKVYDSMNLSMRSGSGAPPIPLQIAHDRTPQLASRFNVPNGVGATTGSLENSAAYRVSIRSTSVLDAVAAPLITAAVTAATQPEAKAAPQNAPSVTPTSTTEIEAPNTDIFVPKVTHLGDRPETSSSGNKPSQPATPQAVVQNAAHRPAADPTDLRQKGGDDAFVF
ncbi:transglycosylase SLT domain-containing protein [Rhodanobacter sp. L36]|uniref:transglycosylase SLT domain-containing protein n=1 Tax=Rhodanobacter sp. L36 TaxID=1747221 RepID=UPI00157512E1